ncbi:MAG: hypothetical protein ACI9Y1_002082 [Lentisphaeria bacterium]|jgi:hypothetical protein
MYLLQRCHAMGHQYAQRSETLEKELGDQFGGIEDAVIVAIYAIERTNLIIENLNGRVRSHPYYRQESGHGFLNLLRFYLNNTYFLRSTRAEHHKKFRRKCCQENLMLTGWRCWAANAVSAPSNTQLLRL